MILNRQPVFRGVVSVLCGLLVAVPPAAGAGVPAADSTRAGVAGAAADTSGAVAGRAPAPGDCFCGRPLPECRSFMILELWLGKRLDAVQRGGRYGAKILDDNFSAIELGYMVNQGRHDAVGASLSLMGTGEARLGLNGRYRRWLTRELALDLMPGVWVKGSSVDVIDFGEAGVSGRFGLMYRDMLGVSAGIDAGKPVPGSRDVEWRGGVRLGSYAATAGLIYAVLVAGLYVVVLINASD